MANTIRYYEENADRYIRDTVGVDMSPIQARFLSRIPPNGMLLDAGCGSGRDTQVFLQQGFGVHAIDASQRIAQLASNRMNIPVEVLCFQDITYNHEFDGIWACASLLHVPRAELPEILRRMHRALKSGAVLYASFKYGDTEGERDGRHFTDMDEEGLEHLIDQVAGLSEIETWVTEDCRPGRANEHWLNTLLRSEAVT